jgi:peroxiredoxin Q/BCP
MGAIMRRFAVLGLFVGALLLAVSSDGTAQEEASFLAVGEMAPDFEFAGATRYGVISRPLHLSDFRGETVVLAFFFRVRTPG